MIRFTLTLAVAAVAIAPFAAEAQQRPVRRQQSIEIVGQVPTPQVVTVRPREMPQYDRRVLVPTFYDHDFWQSILPGYLVVRQRTITGAVPGDSMAARRDSAGAVPPSGAPPATTNPPPAGTTPPPAGGSPPPPATTLGQPAAGPAQPPVGDRPREDDARRVPPSAGSPALPPR
jgi:hypothetical protein